MIELLRDVLPWLFGFYLLEGVANVRRAQLLLVHGLGRWQVLRSGLQVAAFWPSAQVYCGSDLPFLYGAGWLHLRAGAETYERAVLQPEDFVAVEWPEPAAIEVRRKTVLLAGARIHVAPTELVARALAAELKRIAGAKKRAAEIRDVVSERFAAPALAGQQEKLSRFLRALGTLSLLCFAGWFMGLPAIAFYAPPAVATSLLLRLGLELLVLHVLVLVAAIWTLRRAGLGAEAGRLVTALAILPSAGARVLQTITRELFAGFDPHTIAQVCLPAAQARPLLRRRSRRAAAERENFAGHDAAVHLEATAQGLATLFAAL
ncbi:MAG TPA: hypothetical protein VH083_27690, partial [Myxococcales bacterium]|nr:hypothetical protein [Myxococcales bacterium]